MPLFSAHIPTWSFSLFSLLQSRAQPTNSVRSRSIPAHRQQNLAVVGCGAVAELSIVAALEQLKLKPRLFVDRSEQQAEALAIRFGAAIATTTAALTEHGVNAAIIATPNGAHATVALDLLDAGVHVLVEKPMAVSGAECDAMIAAADASGACLAVGQMYRFSPAYRWVKALIDAGTLGEIRHVEVRTGAPYGWPLKSGGLWRRDVAGGGVLIDAGVHILDLLLWWLGDLCVEDYRDDNYGGVEADCLLTASTASGGEVIAEFSRTREMPRRLRIEGARGAVGISLAGGTIDELSGAAASFDAGPRLSRTAATSHIQLFASEIEDWLAAIAARRQPFVTGHEAARVVRLIETCYRQRREWELPWMKVPGAPHGAAA